MIQKIIASGRRGAEQGALDVALELGISYGGSIPDDAADLAHRYRDLAVLSGAGFRTCLEKNVAESDGTLIVTFGPPAGDAGLARRLALIHKRQLLHIDAARTDAAEAARLALSWIDVYRIGVLHVTGSDDARAEGLHTAVVHMLVFLLEAMGKGPSRPAGSRVYPIAPAHRPGTLEQAVQRLAAEMRLRDKAVIANAGPGKAPRILRPMTDSVIVRLGLDSGNDSLIDSCRFVSRDPKMGPREAAYSILEALWILLRTTHSIRVVK